MRAIVIGLVLAGGVAQAGIYKCKVDGVTVYQASPCAKEGEEIRVRSTPASVPAQRIDDRGNDRPKPGGRKTTRHSERAYLAQLEIDKKNHEIDKHNKNIKRYRKMMRSELAALKRKKGYARNNLAGATWEQSISTEMRAVTEKYQQMIDSEKYDIDALKDEIKELRKQL